jgi:hypothetical protein
MYEWVGYLASLFVAVSITIRGGIYFRILNMAGSVCFLVYAIIIRNIPIMIINIYGIGIHIFHIIKIFTSKKAEQPAL